MASKGEIVTNDVSDSSRPFFLLVYEAIDWPSTYAAIHISVVSILLL